RAKLLDNGDMPPPPYTLVENENTWLDQTDLVFIDPVGTGYSRAKTPELARKFNGVQGDLQSVGEFMRMYLNRNGRWVSPLFIAGESYGTFRATALARAEQWTNPAAIAVEIQYRKSTRLNSSHLGITYAAFFLMIICISCII